MEKNPNFPDLGSDIPPGKIDKITTKIIKSAQRQAQDVISGELDYMQDPPPADIKPEVKAEYSDRYREQTAASTYYMFMNTRRAAVRRPEGARGGQLGLDKPALARIFAGEVGAGLLVPAARPAGLRRGARRRGLPVGQPERAAGPREGAADDQGRRRGRHGGHRLRQQRRPDRQGHRGVRRPAQQDGLQGNAEDPRRRRLLPDHRKRQDEGPDGLPELVPGLPPPEELLLPGGRQVDPADEQPELRERRRSRRSPRASPS